MNNLRQVRLNDAQRNLQSCASIVDDVMNEEWRELQQEMREMQVGWAIVGISDPYQPSLSKKKKRNNLIYFLLLGFLR